MRFISAVLLALALISPAFARRAPLPAPPPPENAGGLIDHVNGYALDQAGHLAHFTGLLISKDGKVKRLLSAADERPAYLDFRLDAHGRTLIPGLIDAHGHVMELGFAATSLDLSGTTSLADAQTKLAAWAAAHPKPEWVRGFGWNQERWRLGRFPTAADIDGAAGDRPVVLERVDGHAVLANAAAMRAAGITRATQAPPGGRIERDANGEPTGVFVDKARALIDRAVPPPLPRERDEALAAAQDELLSYGVVATCDMGTPAEDWAVFRRAGDNGRLRVRIISYALGLEPLLAIAGAGPTPWLYGDHLRMVGMKLFADGALGSRGAWLKQPYSDQPDTRGLQLLDDAKLQNLMSRAAMDGFQVAVHAIGDAANAQVLDAIDQEAATYTGDRRWRIEHAQIVDPADLPRFAKHGIVASMQPEHQVSDRPMAEARLGPDRLIGAYAWKTMLNEGVPLAFGSDFPVEKPDPLEGMAAAISRQGRDGQPTDGWHPEQRISLEQALAAYTSGAAYAGFAEDRLGGLAVGKDADFLLLDRDPFTGGPEALRATHVEETWIGGKRAWVRK